MQQLSALVTDDDPISLMILSALLESLSLDVVLAENVTKAKQLLHAVVPRFAILDVQLPDGDGADILVEIRENEFPTLVIFITGSLQEFPFHKCGTVQPDAIFSKPIDTEALRLWIVEHLPHATKQVA